MTQKKIPAAVKTLVSLKMAPVAYQNNSCSVTTKNHNYFLMARLSATELQSEIGGLDYPVGKEEIKKHLKSKGVSEQVMGVFSLIPDKKYNTPIELTQALGQVEY